MDILNAWQIEVGDIIAEGDDFITVEDVEYLDSNIRITGLFYNSEMAVVNDYDEDEGIQIVTNPEELA